MPLSHTWFLERLKKKARKGARGYPLFSGATIALMVLSGAVLFGERVSATMVAGCVVIVAGIALIARQ